MLLSTLKFSDLKLRIKPSFIFLFKSTVLPRISKFDFGYVFIDIGIFIISPKFNNSPFKWGFNLKNDSLLSLSFENKESTWVLVLTW